MSDSVARPSSASEARESKGFFGRIVQFLREVLLELKKVTYPTGPELLRFTIVVMVFVAFMMLLVTGLDFVFGKGAMWLFGGSPGK
ncbi:preprotein translocase subunit SecE [Arthrobacter sp. UM1]|uniref:preprotein translocase subunit SecE n=1 Tax=Arthrobacter sp. UM1 TaxID=2766776 RepID=UPI001CF70ACB|nr:preprotein translocase subunit SecE [Arthrobacter sp. UM1]MCB4208317.1 preprotein translocase subunit SecE [Arthrobacter sp. UM1]